MKSEWEHYEDVAIFKDIVTYLQFSREALRDISRSKLKALMH